MTNKLLLSLLILSFSQLSVAQTAPSDQVSIKAGKQQAQLKTNIGIFEENVEIIHGNREIYADRLEVHQREELGENKQLLVATGKPARFIEKQSDGTVLSASAEEVRYDVANRLLTIKGKAEINQAGQVIKAEAIIYDIEKQLISAEQNEQNKQRVHTILVPEKKTPKSNSEQGK
ncbi:lipopolysaccharide transport periplasmic protein LptA [Pseudoalteromonas phenolica]|jgi:lipopolysaccharide export system protein LptA|uniref:lipopolysaccharide transport periplasmic protein LptA n=1 Tax=Pseudoalteromonas phenolica TaxID=161398 RepID=UPI00110BC0CB|nr:lipopolysaccharide transport periplasmic protein LptA [Pseudoalteromonas phenolica]TMN92228.1 lipopolysaccharide transport periplasmic protein LptA [Pseudoalteromonas phenolica]